MEYSVDFFINKFTKIQSKNWCVGVYVNDENQKCVYGHCGVMPGKNLSYETSTIESVALTELGSMFKINFVEVNDGIDTRFNGKNAKERVLSALKYIKNINGE